MQTVPEVDERRSGPPASPFATTDLLGRFLSRYWGVELAVGVLTGLLLLLLLFAAEQFVIAAVAPTACWMWAIFGVLVTAAGVVALVNPVDTFTGLADILGFIFLLIGVQWMVQAFAERLFNPYWWMNLIGAILMVGLAFWVSGRRDGASRPSSRARSTASARPCASSLA